MLNKLYCYVDETGQDTEGVFFLVVVVIKNFEEVSFIENKLKKIEKITEKRKSKWKKTPNPIRIKYLRELNQVRELSNSIFFANYQSSKEYPRLTSLTIAKAILSRKNKNYAVTIIIDGLNIKEKEIVRLELKRLNIKYRKIRGMKDEQNIFLRLADNMAGFIRDSKEGKSYTKEFLRVFKDKKIITEI